MSKFHYSNGGKEAQGPCDLDYLRYLLFNGTITRTSMISPESSGQWIPLGEYLEALDGGGLQIKDIKMPFLSMVVFMVKWAIAAIPAIIILWTIAALLLALFGAFFGALFAFLQT
jgi:hypothetical protein